jgi:hypothetical protein
VQPTVKILQDGSKVSVKFEHCESSPRPSIAVSFPVAVLEISVVERDCLGGLRPDDVRDVRFASNKGDLAVDPTESAARVKRDLDFNFMICSCWVDGTSFPTRIYSAVKQNELNYRLSPMKCTEPTIMETVKGRGKNIASFVMGESTGKPV